jgi:integrase
MTGGVEKYCECGSARWPKCAHPWYMLKFRYQRKEYAPNITRHARVVLATAITTKTEADAVADRIRADIRSGAYVSASDYRPAVAPPVQGRTLDDLAQVFDDLRIAGDTNKKPNSKVNDRAILKRLRATDVARGRLGALPMETLTLDDLVAFRAARKVANSTWNKQRTVLGQLFRWAKWSGHISVDLIAAAPPDVLKLLRRGKAAQRNRRLDDRELDNLKEAARELHRAIDGTRLYALVIALLESGARVGELLALQWRDVQLYERMFFVRAEEIGAGKTGLARVLEISQPLYDVLVTLTHDPAGQEFKRTDYVFGDAYGGRIKSIDKAWSTAVLRAYNIEPQWTDKGGLTAASRADLARINLHAHDLRHEAACRWLESGYFDLAQISRILGHTSLAQTATYVHATGASVRLSQRQYDAARAAQQTAAAAAAGDNSRPSGGKAGENATAAAHTRNIPRLIKGSKSH